MNIRGNLSKVTINQDSKEYLIVIKQLIKSNDKMVSYLQNELSRLRNEIIEKDKLIAELKNKELEKYFLNDNWYNLLSFWLIVSRKIGSIFYRWNYELNSSSVFSFSIPAPLIEPGLDGIIQP